MRKTDRHLSDQECRDILAEIVNMVLDTHNKPIRKGFGLRLAQSGYDLDSILRNHQVICPGEPNEQERLTLKPKEAKDEPEEEQSSRNDNI